MHTINWKNAIIAGIAGVDMAIGSLVRHWIYVIPYLYFINREMFAADSSTNG